MDKLNLSRRRFFKGMAAGAAVGLLPNVAFIGSARAAGAQDNVLVVIHLDGGCDGLSMVVPYVDPLYAAARPTLALGAAGVLPLNESLALNAAMPGLKSRYDAGQVAIINGVGYPSFNRSHFAAEDIYWTADPSGAPDTGWLGRALDRIGNGSVLSGAFIGSALPKSMLADTVAVPAVPSVQSYTYQAGAGDAAQLAAIGAIFGQTSIGLPLFDGLLVHDRAAMASVDVVQAAASAYQTAVPYGSDPLSQSLKLAAQLVHANIGARVISTDLGGFDTHSNQANSLPRLLGEVSGAIDSFFKDAEAGGFAQRVTVLVWTEFGRRVAENGSGGTDHGTAMPMLLIGSGVKGGIYGAKPNLADLDSGDLRMSTDFRSVYASALGAWLGVDAAGVLGGEWAKLPVFL